MYPRRIQNVARRRENTGSGISSTKNNFLWISLSYMITWGHRKICFIYLLWSRHLFSNYVFVLRERDFSSSAKFLKSKLYVWNRGTLWRTLDSVSNLHPVKKSCETIPLINPMVSHLTVTSGPACGTPLTSPKPQYDTRSGKGLNGCVGPCKAPRMAHCTEARGVEGTQWGVKQRERHANPQAIGVLSVTRKGSRCHVSSFVLFNLEGSWR